MAALLIGVPEALRGGAGRCEHTEHGHACGFRASYWDGHRLLCREHRPQEPTWQRREGGYMRSDGEWFLLRGARMTNGGTAWLIHRRMPEERIGREGERFAYDTRDGAPLWVIDDTGYADTATTDHDGPLYAHVGDEGWLADAKIAVDHTETREARA